jgi:hypothetical protein
MSTRTFIVILMTGLLLAVTSLSDPVLLPEPVTFVLTGAGLLALVFLHRRLRT